MSIISNIWDWPYRVFFDSTAIPKTDNKRYLNVIAFYTSFYTLDNLLLNCTEDTIQKALDNVDKLVHLPNVLNEIYLAKFSNTKFSDIGRKLVKKANESTLNVRDSYTDCLNVIFNGSIPTFDLNLPTPNFSIPQKRIEGPLNNIALEYIHDLIHNPQLIDTYGPMPQGEFDIIVGKGTGFAEWWAKELCNSDKEVLVLYDNSNTRKELDFFYTLIHEVYPGHGLFYRTVKVLDHGATSHIEGWATYAEWNALPSDYTVKQKYTACRLLQTVFNNQGDAMIEKLMSLRKSLRYDINDQLRTVDYVTQKIGFLESYYLGALAIEQFYDKPKNYLQDIKEGCTELW